MKASEVPDDGCYRPGADTTSNRLIYVARDAR
jgi:hypothetical protein